MRRGHGSTKVPNVKLRPPPPKEKAKSSITRRRATEDDDSMNLDEGPSRTAAYRDYNKASKPFANVILCSTGIRDKVTLFKQASELGALCQHDLTSDITHLVATETGSAKYNCAIENGMMVMTPEWVEETYNTWLAGDDVDFAESVRKHRLPFFNGFTICVTGSDIEASRRQEIGRIITEHGGIYSASLTKQCTHLLVSAPSYESAAATDKVRFALRVNREGKAQIKVLWVEWYHDCIAVGGKLDENKYELDLPRPQPKLAPVTQPFTSIGASSGTATSASTSQQLPSAPRPPAQPVALDLSKDAPEPASIPNMSQLQRTAQQQALWQQLRQANLPSTSSPGAGGSQSASQKKGKQKITIDLPPLDESMDGMPSPGNVGAPAAIRLPTPVDGGEGKSVLSRLALQKASSFHQPFSDTGKGKGAPFSHHPLAQAAAGPSAPSAAAVLTPVTTASQQRKQIFAGMSFVLIGDARTGVLEGAIKSSGGEVLDRSSQGTWESEADEPQWYVVRLNTGARHLPKNAPERHLQKYVTECWVEECLHEERVCSPEEHVTFRPLSIPTPLGALKNTRLHISGLEEGNALYTQRLARTLGAQVAVVFSKKSTTHLLLPRAEGVKWQHAVQWGIPAVRVEWLWEIARTGRVPPVERYVVGAQTNGSGMVDVTDHVPQNVAAPQPPVLPSPPQENIQPPNLSPLPLPASSASTPHRSSPRLSPSLRRAGGTGKSPLRPANSSATEALSHLAKALGEKRKSSTPDGEEKVPAKKKTRPITRVRSGDISGPSTSAAGKSTFAPFQPFPPEPSPASADDTDMSTEITVNAPLGESIRVMYDDPEARAAKRNLMKLIGEIPESVDPVVGNESMELDPPPVSKATRPGRARAQGPRRSGRYS